MTFLALKEAGTLGRIVEFESHFDRHIPEPSTTAHWRNGTSLGNGLVYDLGVHLMDQIVVAFGLPVKVTAIVGTPYEGRTAEHEDAFTILLQYPDGMVATAKVSVISPEERQLRYWVRGTKASYKKFDLDCQEDQIMDGKKITDSDFGIEPSERHGIVACSFYCFS